MICMRRMRPLSLFLFFLPLTILAQDARQALNDELWTAARKGDAAAVKTLLDRGADVNAKFRYGATALSYAADKGHVEVVKLLIERGADVNVKDTFYKSPPIIWATLKGHAPIVQALLDKNAEGIDNVLGIAAGEGKVEVVRIVLAKGGAKTESLSSALAAAEKNKHAEIVEMLKKAGAVPPPKADFQVDLETLKSYEGTYRNERAIELTVSIKDGKLIAVQAGQFFTLGAFDKVTFRPLEVEGSMVTFNAENGKVISFTFKQGETKTIFMKVENTKQP